MISIHSYRPLDDSNITFLPDVNIRSTLSPPPRFVAANTPSENLPYRQRLSLDWVLIEGCPLFFRHEAEGFAWFLRNLRNLFSLVTRLLYTPVPLPSLSLLPLVIFVRYLTAQLSLPAVVCCVGEDIRTQTCVYSFVHLLSVHA